MKDIQIVIFDDVEFGETGERVPATDTITLGWQGNWVELDLSDEHARDLWARIKRYYTNGHAPGEGMVEPKQTVAGSYAYYRDLRAWADSEGRSDEYHAKPRNNTKATGYSYSKKLRSDYRRHLASLAE